MLHIFVTGLFTDLILRKDFASSSFIVESYLLSKVVLSIERFAGVTFITSLTIGSHRFAVDCFCKDSGTGCFPYTAWTAEEVSMGKFFAFDGILQCCGKRVLSDYLIECHRTVFSCGNNIICHFVSFIFD